MDLRLNGVESGVVHVLCRNRAQSGYLQKHCRSAFCEAAQAATGRLVSVTFSSTESEDDTCQGTVPTFDDAETGLPINPDYTFEEFVTGPSNRLAHAASLAVARSPGHVYNPLFIYGAGGFGKTHLLQAVCHEVRSCCPEITCCYISCEAFINHFIEAVERGMLKAFRYRYRHVDMLVIDDVHVLSERERSQEEFFHTFNELHQTRRQIVLSADCSPAGIPGLEERLVTRFGAGLVAVLDSPSMETRMAIVRRKARLRCIELPEAVVRYVAEHAASSIRELEGALLRLDASSQLQEGRIDLDLARATLGGAGCSSKSVPVTAVLQTIARHFGLKVTDLQGKNRSKAVTYPRHLCMYLARQLCTQSLAEIGGYFGGRDHTTVLHANRSIERLAEKDPVLRRQLDEMAAAIKNGGTSSG